MLLDIGACGKARYTRVQGLRKPLDVLKSELGRASTYARAFPDAAASRQLTRSSKYPVILDSARSSP
jgi:hypothetical protein